MGPAGGRLDPEAGQLQLDRVEGLDAHRVGPGAHRDDRPCPVPQPQDLERPLHRVDEPGIRDTRLGVDPKLPAAVDALGGRREDFANPVRSEGEVGRIRYRGHALTPPTGQVGHQHVLAEMKLRLVEDPPASGSALAVVEWSKHRAEAGRGNRVARRRPRAQEELAVQDLRHLVLGGAQHVFVRRSLQPSKPRCCLTNPVYAAVGLRGKIALTSHHPPPKRVIVPQRMDSEGPIA